MENKYDSGVVYKQKAKDQEQSFEEHQSAKVKMKKHEDQWIHIVNDIEGMTRDSGVGNAKVR